MAFKYPAARRDESKVSAEVLLGRLLLSLSVCRCNWIAGKARPGRAREKRVMCGGGGVTEANGDDGTKTKTFKAERKSWFKWCNTREEVATSVETSFVVFPRNRPRGPGEVKPTPRVMTSAWISTFRTLVLFDWQLGLPHDPVRPPRVS